MAHFLPTIILRHAKENLKKCSLRGLETREDCLFYRYPLKAPLPDLTGYVLLDFEGEPISEKDKGVVLIDGTWRYAQKMAKALPAMPKRSLPKGLITAYPRKQEDCQDPSRGLASVEALFAAYFFMKRDPTELLNHYHWEALFLLRNRAFFPFADKLEKSGLVGMGS